MSAISIPIESSPGLMISRAPEAPAAAATPAANTPVAAPDLQQPLVLQQNQIKASFQYDQDLSTIIITLRREDNGQVIRQIPSEKMLNILAGIMDSIGKVLDATV
jgi:hypothetical protein